jgi:DNA-binding NarL/FixJ family response regulator
MGSAYKNPDGSNSSPANAAHSVEQLSTQVTELGVQVQIMIRLVETLQGRHRPLRTLDSPVAVCDAVHHVYRSRELTPREVEVCALLIRGYADGEIARTLGTRVGTIKTHAARVCQKLNLDRKRIPWDFFVRLAIGDGKSAPQLIVEECPSLWRRRR